MITWFIPPRRPLEQTAPPDKEIIDALEAMLSIESPKMLQQICLKRQPTLRDERTLSILCLTIAQERVQENSDTAETLLDLFDLLLYLEQQGLDSLLAGLSSEEEPPESAEDEQTILRKIALHTRALIHVTRTTHPMLWAELRRWRADYYMRLAPLRASDANLERAILDYDAALTVLTQDRTPELWAKAHMGRGLAYKEHSLDEQGNNLEQAILDYTDAMQVYTLKKAPLECAALLVERGLAYGYRKQGNHNDNLKLAQMDFEVALTALSPIDTPVEWAKTYLYRLTAYMEREQEDTQIIKYERAIRELTTLFGVISFETAPDEWLEALQKRAIFYMEARDEHPYEYLVSAIRDTTVYLEKAPKDQRNARDRAHMHRIRAIAYSDYRLSGNHLENTKQALNDFNDALEVFTREQTPADWALALTGRSAIYHDFAYMSIDSIENLKCALIDLNNTLEVLQEEDTLEERGDALLNRGLCYIESSTFINHPSYIEWAIQDLSEALTIFQKHNDAYRLGLVYTNLCFAYCQRRQGSQVSNLDTALQYCEKALQYLSPTRNPTDWANAMSNRGFIRTRHPLGDRKNNLELAISDFDEALKIFTRERYPLEWARTGVNRVLAYTELFQQTHREQLDNALNDYNVLLEMLNEQNAPRYWAIARMNRGIVYLHRTYGVEAENIELALADFHAVRNVFNPETTFEDWVLIHINRGLAYRRRIRGNPEENMELAIADYKTALRALSPEHTPLLWAQTCLHLAASYLDRTRGDLTENFQQVIAYSKAAMTIFTGDTAPREYCDCQLMLTKIYEQQQRWQDMRQALDEVRRTINGLLEAATTDAKRLDIIAERDSFAIPVRYARAALHMEPPDIVAALCALEEGRAQNFRARLALDEIHSNTITDPAACQRAEAFLAARNAWIAARQRMTDTEFINLNPQERLSEYRRRQVKLENTYAVFKQARDAIRQHDDPQFLLSDIKLEEIGKALPTPGSALVYLAAQEQEGIALIVWRTPERTLEIDTIPLPKLTRKAVTRLAISTDELPPAKLSWIIGGMQEMYYLSGGYWPALLGAAFETLLIWGDSISQAMHNLPLDSVFLDALQQWIHGKTRLFFPQRLLNLPFTHYTLEERMACGAAFSQVVIDIEMQHSLPRLAEMALDNVAEHLQKHNIQDVTLIPYGFLGLFPLPAVPVWNGNGARKRLGELFITTISPSAQAKAVSLARAQALDRTSRPLLLNAGNPQPLPATISSLPYAQTEADSVRRIADAYGYSNVCYLRPREVTRERVIEALGQAWYAHLAIHGQYNLDQPRSSHLILAGNETVSEDKRHIYLSEALDGIVNLTGLRLLVLSACETALIDTGNTPNEMLGLAAGFLQAGAAGVIASLWAVDDLATFVLMSKFAELYLDPRHSRPPAQALAEAQRWLREEATYRVLMTYDPLQELAEPHLSQNRGLPPNLPSTLRGLRPGYKSGLAQLQLQATVQAAIDPDALPFANPIYWAGFVVTGS
ncbi:MAG TPA: CHAT domain-containing protein [Ktedonobacteraceae bacterium]|jgi:CHAT domain-containing protein|nr:CHAT domain-containing protein [Ktedonobacteraceae bacterium]